MISPMVAARGSGWSTGVRVLVGCCSFPVLDSMTSDTVAVGSSVLVNGSSCRCATLFVRRTCFNPTPSGSCGGSNEETVRRVRINDNDIASLIAASNVEGGRAKTCAIRCRVKGLQHRFAHVSCPKGTHRHTRSSPISRGHLRDTQRVSASSRNAVKSCWSWCCPLSLHSSLCDLSNQASTHATLNEPLSSVPFTH